MRTNLNHVVRSRESTEQFLFSKTDMKQSVEKPIAEPFSVPAKLIELFPDIAAGDAFMEAGIDLFSSVFSFSAMAIKVDDAVGSMDKDLREDVLVDAAKSIDACCKKNKGVWGQLNQNLLGCFFADNTVSSCPDLAKKIQKTLSEFRNETVSIGIAGYPTINYHKKDILQNAQKALDHAAYYGSNSIVTFDAVSLNISGDQYYAQGNVHDAVEEFKRALRIDPSNVNVHNSLGVCYGVLGDLEKAIEEFEGAIWLDPEEFMAVYNIGIVSLLKGEKEKAIAHFLTADSLTENIYEIAFQIGRLYLEMNNFEEGKKYLEESVKLKPDAGTAFRCLGDCYATLENVDKAISAYKSSIKLNPNDAAALSAIGCLYDIQGENAEISTTFCLQSVEISPDNGLYRHRLGDLYLKQNRFTEALKEFEAAQKLGHDSSCSIEEIQNRLSANASPESSPKASQGYA